MKRKNIRFAIELAIGFIAALALSGWVVWRSAKPDPPLITTYKNVPIQWQDYALVAAEAVPIVDEAPQATKDAASKSVVGIFPLSLKGSLSKMSSGVVMTSGADGVSIVTNRHVIKSIASYEGTQGSGFSGKVGVYFESQGEKYIAEGTVICVGGKSDIDIAIVRIPGENAAYLSPAKMPNNLDKPAIDTPVWVAGSADGVYGNLRATKTISPPNPNVTVKIIGIDSKVDEFKPQDLIWYAARSDGSPAGPYGASGGALLDGDGTLRAFIFMMDAVTKEGAAIGLKNTNQWLENPTCDTSYLSANAQPQSSPQTELLQAQRLPKQNFRPIGQGRPPGQSRNPPGTDNQAALAYFKTSYDAVVCVGGFEPSIGKDVCASGTSIDPALIGRDPSEGAVIITCDHVIANTGPSPDIKLKTVRSESLPGSQVIYSSRSKDLALVAVSQTLPIASIAPADYEPEPGTPVWAIGFPRTARGEMVISPDGVAQGMMSECLAESPCIAIGDGVITNGNSGGFLGDDQDRLIGVTEGETIEEIAISPAQIHAFLEEAKSGDSRGSGERTPPSVGQGMPRMNRN